MSDYAESSTTTAAALYARNDDFMTVTLRGKGRLDLEDIVDLNRATTSPPQHAGSSLGTRSTSVFSSREQSNGTQQTSAGTSYYVVRDQNGDMGKAIARCASPNSATHGSASEAEAEQEHALVGIGDWAGGDLVMDQPLKGAARARKRPRVKRHKKPVVIIQHDAPYHASSADDESPTIADVPRGNGKASTYLRRRPLQCSDDRFAQTERGRVVQHVEQHHTPAREPLSGVRLYIFITLMAAIGLTLALSTCAALHIGKARTACLRGVAVAAILVISSLSVPAMLAARRTLQEALLLGLFEMVFGFVLVVEIYDWMRHV